MARNVPKADLVLFIQEIESPKKIFKIDHITCASAIPATRAQHSLDYQ
jgi:hypothetical protein